MSVQHDRSSASPAVDSPDADDFGFADAEDQQLADLLDTIQAAHHDLLVSRASAPQIPTDLASEDPTSDFIAVPLLDDSLSVPSQTLVAQDTVEAAEAAETIDTPVEDDTRSPLERFRAQQNKNLSVTDFVGPAYCELKYWYNLVEHGRVRTTPAMREGRKVHKQLEDEVKVSVKVSIQTPEDYYGVRVWNVIQSLRSLRITGVTREIAVWGVVGGHLINGVIDHLSYVCPNPDMETQSDSQLREAGKGPAHLPADQKSIADYFSSQTSSASEPAQAAQANDQGKVFITDVKTRGIAALPSSIAFFPTHIQLMLYRFLLVQMATGQVDPNILFSRRQLDPQRPFSDIVIQQLSTVSEMSSDSDDADEEREFSNLETDIDVVAELLGHNSLAQLWQLMQQEFKLTFPRGEQSIGQTLSGEFRLRVDGSIIGTKSALNDPVLLDAYMQDEIQWWQGDRPAKGVPISHSYKCNHCEHAEHCGWRIAHAEALTKANRARKVVKDTSKKKAKS